MVDLFSRRKLDECSDLSSCSKLRLKSNDNTIAVCQQRQSWQWVWGSRQKAVAGRSYCHSSSPSAVGALQYLPMTSPKWNIFFGPKHCLQPGGTESVPILDICIQKERKKALDTFGLVICNTSVHCNQSTNSVACQCDCQAVEGTCIWKSRNYYWSFWYVSSLMSLSHSCLCNNRKG